MTVECLDLDVLQRERQLSKEMVAAERRLVADRAIVEPKNARHLSKSAEHFTPQHVIDAARETLVRINMDPASSRHANDNRVKADVYYSAEENGFTRQWGGS